MLPNDIALLVSRYWAYRTKIIIFCNFDQCFCTQIIFVLHFTRFTNWVFFNILFIYPLYFSKTITIWVLTETKSTWLLLRPTILFVSLIKILCKMFLQLGWGKNAFWAFFTVPTTLQVTQPNNLHTLMCLPKIGACDMHNPKNLNYSFYANYSLVFIFAQLSGWVRDGGVKPLNWRDQTEKFKPLIHSNLCISMTSHHFHSDFP